MCTTVVATRNKWIFACLGGFVEETFKCVETQCRRFGAYQDEVVIHSIKTLGAVAVSDECVFGGAVMHQQRVGIAVFGNTDCLACANGDDFDGNSSIGREHRQKVIVQARVLGRCRRRKGDRIFLGTGRSCQYQKKGREEFHLLSFDVVLRHLGCGIGKKPYGRSMLCDGAVVDEDDAFGETLRLCDIMCGPEEIYACGSNTFD